MKHAKEMHPNNENLVYTDQNVRHSLSLEVEKYVIKFKGPGMTFFSTPPASIVEIKER